MSDGVNVYIPLSRYEAELVVNALDCNNKSIEYILSSYESCSVDTRGDRDVASYMEKRKKDYEINSLLIKRIKDSMRHYQEAVCKQEM